MKKAIVLSVMLALPGVAQSQWWEGPPTYDYVAEVPGVQPPRATSPGALLDGFQQRMMRHYQVQFTVSVSLSDLQAALPPGFVAIATPPGSETAALSVAFALGQVNWYASFGASAPYTYAFFVATAFNQGRSRLEQVILAVESSSAASVEQAVAVYGPGTARLAEIEEEVEVEGSVTRFKLKVKDEAIGLRLTAEALCPGPIEQRAWLDPDYRIFRFTDGQMEGVAFRQVYKGDFRIVLADQAGARVEAKEGYLRFPGGAVRLLGLIGSVSFGRSVESFRRTLSE